MKWITFKSRDWWTKNETVQILIWLVIENLQSLSYHYETWSKWQTFEVVLLTKFHDDSQKIVDFSFVDNFDLVWFFFLISLSYNAIKGKKLSSNFKLSDIIFQRLLDFRPKLKMTLISLIMIYYFILLLIFAKNNWSEIFLKKIFMIYLVEGDSQMKFTLKLDNEMCKNVAALVIGSLIISSYFSRTWFAYWTLGSFYGITWIRASYSWR